MSVNQSILIGYSGHAYVVAEAALEIGVDIIGYSDKNPVPNNPFNLEYLGFENNPDFIGWQLAASFILGIGDNSIRQKIAELVITNGKELLTVISKSASVSKTAKIGYGTFINRNAAVNALSIIGNNVILNTGCIVEHECVLGDAVHIAPGAVLAGNVTVGERSFIGANSVIKQGVAIGKDVIIGAGTVIIHDIPDGKKVVGNPGKYIE
ncbi:acetyltransferase [Flavobacterium cerinum]|uniref:Acetyltransferase n=1 Tax=Flavobacterium cerinum TaxID=2502784 RepID=A0A3S3QEB3_9FLAO|nr:acetyltransferase [Flavobacterium cerinum]RWX02377.1 acetyltransferase [Flavobacterium cerinum]